MTISFAALQRALEEHSTEEAAKSLRTQARPLRGIRGVPPGTVARLTAETWRTQSPSLPGDVPALEALFSTAWEDGLAAIGLAAAALPQDPEAAWTLGLLWARRTDDLFTADALGWLLLGPAAGRLDRVEGLLTELGQNPFPFIRRAVASSALAFTPAEIEGAAAGALREQAQARQVRLSERLQGEVVGRIVSFFVRDDEPMVQKALRRTLRLWAEADPEGLLAWAPTVKGGLPRLLGDEIARVRPGGKKGSRGRA